MNASKIAKRRRGGAAPEIAPPAICAVCGTAWKDHPVCAACGIGTGPGHEQLVKEPYGRHLVCAGCHRQLVQRRQRISKPMLANRQGVIRFVDRLEEEPDATAACAASPGL